jgi:hypothetical protein
MQESRVKSQESRVKSQEYYNAALNFVKGYPLIVEKEAALLAGLQSAMGKMHSHA